MKRKVGLIILLIAVLTFAICLPLGDADAMVLKKGSKGESVKDLQRALANGYYFGGVDGVFGNSTETAVKKFQKDAGLTADGIAGSKTLKLLGVEVKSTGSGGGSQGSYNDSDLYLLAKTIHAEARGEVYEGKVAVGAVILNRVKSSEFPNSISGVVYQPWAFTAVHDGQINLEPNDEAMRAAKDAMNGWDPTNGCLYYYNPAKATSKWIFTTKTVTTIGKHVFSI